MHRAQARAHQAEVQAKLAAAHQQELEVITRLKDLGSLFLRDSNLKPVLTEVLNTAISISGADFGNIHIRDPKLSELRLAAHSGSPEWWLDFGQTILPGCGACGVALERGERVIIPDVEQSAIFAGTPALEIHRKAGVRGVQSTPILTRLRGAYGHLLYLL